MLIELLINIIQIYVVIRVVVWISKFVFGKKIGVRRKHKKSIAGKITLLVSNKTHSLFDSMIRKQKARMLEIKAKQEAEKAEKELIESLNSNPKIILLNERKKKSKVTS